jgi:hypothetical protein
VWQCTNFWSLHSMMQRLQKVSIPYPVMLSSIFVSCLFRQFCVPCMSRVILGCPCELL